MTASYRDDGLPCPGDRVGRYTVRANIAVNEWDLVYHADDPGGPVELRLVPLMDSDGDDGRRFEIEMTMVVRALSTLGHPVLRRLYAAGTHQVWAWIASAPAAGPTLTTWRDEAPRPWQAIAAILHDVAAALAVLETTGIFPRKLSEEDIRVGADRRACVDIAVGLAYQLVAVNNAVYTTDSVSADPIPWPSRSFAYDSPEELVGHQATARTTQWALCNIAWHALYGRRPFTGEHAVATATAMLEGRITDPPANSPVPSAIRRALTRGLARDPAARFPSTAALAAALRPGLLSRLRH